MVISIWVDNHHPLEGRAAGADQPPRPFVGWLQLLSVLADLMEHFAEDEPDRRAAKEDLAQDIEDLRAAVGLEGQM